MKTDSYEYTSFPRSFVTYKWYKPLIVAVIIGVFTVVSQLVLGGFTARWIGGGTEELKEAMSRSGEHYFSGPGLLITLGGIAVILPALAVAARIVRDRPFSSYSSSRGGWNWGLFFKCLALSAVVFGGMSIGQLLLFPDADADGVNKFTLIGFLICTVLVPFQASAEEYLFRGLAMQTIGSWTKKPVAAILASSLIFATAHSYGVYGILAVFCNGLAFAVLTWYTKGLEASCAAHIVNNMTVFYCNGFGLSSSSEGGIASLLTVIVMCIVYCAGIILPDRKYGWFTAGASEEQPT